MISFLNLGRLLPGVEATKCRPLSSSWSSGNFQKSNPDLPGNFLANPRGFPGFTQLELTETLSPAQTREHCCRSKIASRTQKNVSGKFQKYFLLSRRKFCVFNICCLLAQTKNHLANTEETLPSNVSRLFPLLRTQATYFEDAEFAS